MAKSFSFYGGEFEDPVPMTVDQMRQAVEMYGTSGASGYEELLSRVEDVVASMEQVADVSHGFKEGEWPVVVRDWIRRLKGC